MSGRKKNKKIQVDFWGVRGSIPAPGPDTCLYGGNTPCVTITYKADYIILDAGSGIRMFGNYLCKHGGSGNNLNLFLTHTHWDHIQGLPFFAAAFIKENRLKIFGPQLFNRGLERVISSQMEYAYFPIRLHNLAAMITFKELGIGRYDNLLDGVIVETFLTNHPVIDIGYKFIFPGCSITYLTDIELFNNAYLLFVQKSNNKNIIKIGQKVFEDLKEDVRGFIAGTDLLIMDSAYTSEEYPDKLGWGHSTYNEVYDLAVSAKVKNLCFFHHDPNRDDTSLAGIEKKYKRLQKKDKILQDVFAAREGMTLRF